VKVERWKTNIVLTPNAKAQCVSFGQISDAIHTKDAIQAQYDGAKYSVQYRFEDESGEGVVVDVGQVGGKRIVSVRQRYSENQNQVKEELELFLEASTIRIVEDRNGDKSDRGVVPFQPPFEYNNGRRRGQIV
jgi:hypothetical protein